MIISAVCRGKIVRGVRIDEGLLRVLLDDPDSTDPETQFILRAEIDEDAGLCISVTETDGLVDEDTT